MEVFVFILGAIIGSFLNVLIDRIPRRESALKGRSHCDSCRHTLSWYDLLPIISFVLLGGRCRYCHKRIGVQALLMELLTATLFLCTWLYFVKTISFEPTFVITFLYTLYIISSFIVVTFIDLKKGIIPNVIIYPAVVVSLLYHLVFFHTALPYFLSSIGAGIFFLFLFLITKGRGMGFGDVKLSVLLGLFLGFPEIIIALYIAFLTGAFVAFILVITKKKKFAGGTIPFGPFLIIGSIIAFFFGDILWNHILLRMF